MKSLSTDRWRWLLTLLGLLLLAPRPSTAAPVLRVLTVQQGAPSWFSADEAWEGLGLDSQGRVWAAYSSYLTPGSTGDVGIVRYTPSTDTLAWMTSFSAIAAAAGNLQPGERFAKQHVDFRTWNGKLYFASHDFHDNTQQSEVRGSHVFVYDPATNQFDDVTRGAAGGVAVAQQGIIGMDVVPSTGMLIGITYPLGDLVRVNLAASPATVALTEHRGFGQVTRKVLATDRSGGTGYFSYYPDSDAPTPLYAIAASTGTIRTTANQVPFGILHGRVVTRDQQTAYLLDEMGRLYRFAVATETLTDLGSLIGDAAHAQYGQSETLTLSNDERSLFSWISCWACAPPQGVLFRYEIATGTRTIEATFTDDPVRHWDRRVTALTTDHRGHIYVLDHAPGHPGEGRLVQVSQLPHSPPRTEARPAPTRLRLLQPVRH